MSYWEQVLPALERQGRITCFDIQQITNTVNPQKVVEQLKKRGYISKFEDIRDGKKYYRVHYR